MSIQPFLTGYYQALSNTDLDTVMSYFHEKNVTASSLKQHLEQMFSLFKLENTIEKSELLIENDDHIIIKDTVSTRKISGPDFQNTRTETIHILSKSNGDWKIHSSSLLDMTPIS